MDGRHPIHLVHRIGAGVIGVLLVAFGVLGLIERTAMFATSGVRIAGLTTNGLLAIISIVVGAVLIGAATRGGPAASNATIVIGGLFVLSGLLNLAVLNSRLNLLAFRLPDVFFSLVVGLLLLSLGLYGRASSQLPPDTPYAQGNKLSRVWQDEDLAQDEPVDPAEARQRMDEIDELANAEHAVADGMANPEEASKVAADARKRTEQRHQEAWRQFERNRGAASRQDDGS